MLQQGIATAGTVVVYESPYRTRDTVQWIAETAGPQTPVVIARELTKVHEEYLRGTAEEIVRQLEERPPIGEVVILFNTETKE